MNRTADSQPGGSTVGLLAMKRTVFILFIAVAASAGAKPFTFKSTTRYADVEFSYSAEAAQIPALVKRFRADLAKKQGAMVDCGKAETEARVNTGSPLQTVVCSSSTKITTSGQSARLLSLARANWAFTGGAHGNGGTTALLWDRRRAKQIDFASLFTSGYAQALRTPYCRALDRERKKRRWEGYQPGVVPEFDTCPQFSELALIPGDPRHRNRFDRIHLIAAPYTAGSYAEGEYDISIPVTARLIAALKPEFRTSFEVQRQ